MNQLIDNISAEVLFLIADRENAWLQRTLQVIEPRADKNIKMIDLPAHHHFHMQEEAEMAAMHINQFFTEQLAQTA